MERVTPIYFDLEATGPDPYQDQIWELAFWDTQDHVRETWRFDPGEPLHPDVEELCGVTWDDLKGEPSFSCRAAAIQRRFQGRILAGYNIRRFDTILLNRQLREAGEDGIPLQDVTEVDPFRVWRALEGRTLEDAIRRFLDRELAEDAHTAEGDVRFLPDLMDAMMDEFGLGWGDVLDLSRPEHEVDRPGKFRLDDDGVVVFDFGSHKGEPVEDHPDYVSWMMREDFPQETKDAIRKLRENDFIWPD